jgi:hypothetical protein
MAQSGSVTSEQPESAAVDQLRRALQTTFPSLTERDRVIKQRLAELHSLADLQSAVMLIEWSASGTDDDRSTVDRSNHEIVMQWFARSARGILRRKEPAGVATVLEMLCRMAERSRAAGEPNTWIRGFAGDLTDLVIQGPPRQRSLAAHALAQIEPPVHVAVPAFSELLRNEDAEMRSAAADCFWLLLQNSLNAAGEAGLVSRPESRSELILAASTILPAVHRGLDDARLEVRRRCLEIIGLACSALTRLMDEPLNSDDSRPLEAEYEELRPLLSALHDLGPILEHFLHNDDLETRILTNKALEDLGLARGRWLRRCAMRREAADEKMLAELLHEALPGLAEELAHPDVRVRRSALDVLETSGPLALPALPALTRALRDPDRFVRWSATRTVGNLGPAAAPQTIDDLTRLLRDPDEELRKAAASALQQLHRSNR